MSRIGKLPITVPANVTVTIENNLVTVKGPKGELARQINKDMILKLEDGHLTVDRPSDDKEHRAMHGLSRTLINNMVIGVSQGFEKKLQLVGVGYRAQAQGAKLNLSLGYSHPIVYDMPEGITVETPSQTEIIIRGSDKQKVGQVAADVRAYRPPEPYKGKGVKYADETILRKETKKKK